MYVDSYSDLFVIQIEGCQMDVWYQQAVFNEYMDLQVYNHRRMFKLHNVAHVKPFANTVVVPRKPRFGGCVCKQYSRQILNEFKMCGVNEA